MPLQTLVSAGLSNEADENGFYLYKRPEGKSGGHGVGWSEIPRYQFKVPAGWDETPVSIADLGGTEVSCLWRGFETFLLLTSSAQITLDTITFRTALLSRC